MPAWKAWHRDRIRRAPLRESEGKRSSTTFFDYLALNDDLQQALAQLTGIVHAEPLSSRARLAPDAERLLRE
ncbi:MAG: hypothetical protein R3B99_23005 [Polyangiales bacterium]